MHHVQDSHWKLDTYPLPYLEYLESLQVVPITRTRNSFSQSVPLGPNFDIFEMYHGISLGVFLGFNDQIQIYNNSNYTTELINHGVENMNYINELNQGKVCK